MGIFSESANLRGETFRGLIELMSYWLDGGFSFHSLAQTIPSTLFKDIFMQRDPSVNPNPAQEVSQLSGFPETDSKYKLISKRTRKFAASMVMSEESQAQNYMNLFANKTKDVLDEIKIQLEESAASVVYASTGKKTHAAGTAWSDASSSKPWEDLLTAKEALADSKRRSYTPTLAVIPTNEMKNFQSNEKLLTWLAQSGDSSVLVGAKTKPLAGMQIAFSPFATDNTVAVFPSKNVLKYSSKTPLKTGQIKIPGQRTEFSAWFEGEHWQPNPANTYLITGV